MLWNCNGNKKIEEVTVKRTKKFQTTFLKWEESGKIPNVVLTQEAYTQDIFHKWEGLFPETAYLNNKEAGCYFKEGSQVTFVYPRDMIKVIKEPITPDQRSLVNRIHCAIFTVTEEEKILICSWHGPHSPQHKTLEHVKKKNVLKCMLQLVDKWRLANGCSAALVGGDYNLNAEKCREVVPQQFTSGELVNASLYIDEKSEKKNDFVIAWPEEKFTLPNPPTEIFESSDPDKDLFDHAPIRYDFGYKYEQPTSPQPSSQSSSPSSSPSSNIITTKLQQLSIK